MSVRLLKSAARKVLYVLATGVALVTIAWWAAQPGKPDAFYDAPAQRPAEPGRCCASMHSQEKYRRERGDGAFFTRQHAATIHLQLRAPL